MAVFVSCCYGCICQLLLWMLLLLFLSLAAVAESSRVADLGEVSRVMAGTTSGIKPDTPTLTHRHTALAHWHTGTLTLRFRLAARIQLTHS